MDTDVLLAEESFAGGDQQAAGVACPDCRQLVQPGFAMNQASCSCGCTFCARCNALYISVPAETAAALPQASSSSSIMGTCSCQAVDQLTLAAHWGPAAGACWPTGAPEQQLLLLNLLLTYQSAVIPLLSHQLLQQLQRAGSLPQWDDVQQVALSIQQQQQQQVEQKELQQADGDNNHAQQSEHGFIPANATPSFTLQGRASTPAARDAMQLDHTPSPAAVAAAAAIKKIKAAETTNGLHQVPQHPVQVGTCDFTLTLQHQQQQQDAIHVVVSSHAAAAASSAVAGRFQQQGGVQQLVAAVLQLDAGVAELGDEVEAEQLQQLAAGVADSFMQTEAAEPPEQQPAIATPILGAAVAAATGASTSAARMAIQFQQQQQEQQRTPGTLIHIVEPQEQLGVDDLIQQQCEPMQQDQQQQEALELAAGQGLPQQLGGDVLTPASSEVLPGKGGRLRLIAGSVDVALGDSSSTQPAGAALAAAVPQLTDFGLQAETPPVLADEPVTLLSTAHNNMAQTAQEWRIF